MKLNGLILNYFRKRPNLALILQIVLSIELVFQFITLMGLFIAGAEFRILLFTTISFVILAIFFGYIVIVNNIISSGEIKKEIDYLNKM